MSKEPCILSKEPCIPSQEAIFVWAKRALYSVKRAPHSAKCTWILWMHALCRPLYSHHSHPLFTYLPISLSLCPCMPIHNRPKVTTHTTADGTADGKMPRAGEACILRSTQGWGPRVGGRTSNKMLMSGEVGGWGRDPFSRNFMSPTPRRKWYLTTGRRFH